jgi:diaminopimelate decarboxylase
METPRYEYSRSQIAAGITYLKNLSTPYGVIVRYAVKANQHPEIINIIDLFQKSNSKL